MLVHDEAFGVLLLCVAVGLFLLRDMTAYLARPSRGFTLTVTLLSGAALLGLTALVVARFFIIAGR